MKIADTDVNPSEVTSIEYNKEKDIVKIKWERTYSDRTVTELSIQVGSKADGLTNFIYEVIKIKGQELAKEIERYNTILKYME